MLTCHTQHLNDTTHSFHHHVSLHDILAKDTVVREILNFHADRPSKNIPPAMLSTNLECSNNLFIYPKSVAFEKFRNVAVRIQVR